MKRYLNQKGSMPLVVLISFIVLVSIASLTGLLLNEKMNIRFSIDKDIKRVYEKESILELTKNLTTQMLLSKEWEIIEDEEVLSSNDLFKIEEMVNEETLPIMGIEGKSYIKEVYTGFTVDDYCQRIDDEEEIVSYECLSDKFEIEVEITIERAGELDTFQWVLKDFVFVVNDAGDKVFVAKG